MVWADASIQQEGARCAAALRIFADRLDTTTNNARKQGRGSVFGTATYSSSLYFAQYQMFIQIAHLVLCVVMHTYCTTEGICIQQQYCETTETSHWSWWPVMVLRDSNDDADANTRRGNTARENSQP